MRAFPKTGTLKSYSQMPIKIQCKCRIVEDYITWSQKYANCVKELAPLEKESLPYEYTARVNFEGKSDPLLI